MADKTVTNGAAPDSGLYLGVGVDGEATGTGPQNKVYIDADGDGKADDATDDNRGFGGGGELVVAYFLRGQNHWGGDFKLTFGGGYRFDPNGMQYYVPASHDAGMYGVSADESPCDGSNCADVERSTFGSFDVRLVPSVTYRLGEHDALALGPVLSGSYYWRGAPDQGGAYAPIPVVENDETLPRDGADPLLLSGRIGGELGLIHDLGDNALLIPKVGFEYGILASGMSGDSPTLSGGDWMARVGVEVRFGAQRPDADHDGLKRAQEKAYGTDPRNPDTDGDALNDGIEDANQNGAHDANETNALDPDTDDDTLKDGVEDVNHDGVKANTETDPLNADTDGDGLNDGLEVKTGTNPLEKDTDGDGLDDGVEDANKNGTKDESETDPRLNDTDGDGLNDGLEVKTGTNPLEKDTDGDGLDDGVEDANKNGAKDEDETDPRLEDTDDDGLNDGLEVKTGTNPLEKDTDGDGLYDGVEVKTTGTGPLDDDSDDDTLKDGVENPEAAGKRPEDVAGPLVDTDSDGSIDALSPDDDGDGVPTATEITDGAKPGDAGSAPGEDVDGDGRNNWLDANADGDEVQTDGEEQDDVLPRNGVADYLEVAPKGYPDADKDGLSDEFERGIGSNPNKKDSDDDGITDDVEYGDSVKLMTSPEISAWEDVDGDKKKNWLDTDSDADSLADGGKAEGRKGEGRVDDDGDGIPAYLDRSSIRITRDGDQIKFDGVINYKKAKADLLPESYPTLYSLSAYLKAHPEITEVTIEGHTSTEGSVDYNRGLSDRRAASVREFLIKEGISESIMVSIGHGESRTLVDESKGKSKKEIEALRAKNRRTEFHIEENAPGTEIIIEQTE